MFYDTVSYAHGLPHDPIKAIIAPRPIGWISAMSSDGAVNLSPYSFFNAFSTRPTIVGFRQRGHEGRRELHRADARVRVQSRHLRSAGPDEPDLRAAAARDSEFEHAGLEREASQLVKPPRVKGVAAALECRLVEIVRLKTSDGDELDDYLVLGHVVGVYIDDRFIKNGLFDTAAHSPSRAAATGTTPSSTKLFSMTRPAGG